MHFCSSSVRMFFLIDPFTFKKLKESVNFEFCLDPIALRRTVGWESKRRFQRAKHTFREKGVIKGKKELVHALRYLTFAIQIAEKGRIYDFSAANKYYEQIINDPDNDFDSLSKRYDVVRSQLREFLATLVPIQEQLHTHVGTHQQAVLELPRNIITWLDIYEPPTNFEPSPNQNTHIIQSLNYLRDKGSLKQLQHEHHIDIYRHSQYTHLFLLRHSVCTSRNGFLFTSF